MEKCYPLSTLTYKRTVHFAPFLLYKELLTLQRRLTSAFRDAKSKSGRSFEDAMLIIFDIMIVRFQRRLLGWSNFQERPCLEVAIQSFQQWP